MTAVTFADKINEKEEIIALWKEVFQDGDDFLVPFVQERYINSRILVVRQNQEIVSMAWFEPFRAKKFASSFPSFNLVGAATRSDCRGRGYMSAIIKAAKQKAYAITLYPEEHLRDFYRSLGFEDSYHYEPEDEVTLEPLGGDVDMNFINCFYEVCYNECGFIRRDPFAWKTILEDSTLYSDGLGGYVLKNSKGKLEYPILTKGKRVAGGMYFGERLEGFYISEFY